MAKLIKLSDEPCYMKALVYAEFGIGKTQLSGTAADHPDMGDVLLIRAEDGAATLRGKNITATKGIAAVGEVTDIFWKLANSRNKPDSEYGRFKTVIIDSATALLQTCREEVVEKNCKLKPNKDPDRIDIRDHGDVNFILTKLFRRYFDLPMHVIVTALVRKHYNTDDPTEKAARGPVRCTPDLAPTLAARVMAFTDFVWGMDAKGNGTRVLLTQPKNGWVAKTRGEEYAKVLPPIVENPTLPELYNLLLKVSGQNNEG